MNKIEEFNDYRAKMNQKILSSDNKVIKRIFNLDTNAFSKGALDTKTKELLGLSCSMVLRCDDCVKYHLGKCFEIGVAKSEVYEAFSIANLIGGTIVIPHLRRAVEFWEELELNANA
ncbi:MAG: carboxymuconolactone decarboxylase family protein [Bacteroidota bacterium]